MAPVRAIMPIASDELFTQNSLLQLPNRRWAYIEGNVNSSGQLRPGYVMNASGLRSFLRAAGGSSTARHPIDNRRSYQQKNIKHVPSNIIAAYRSAMSAPASRRSRSRSLSPNTLQEIAVMESRPRSRPRSRSRSRSRSLSANTLAQIASMNRRSRSLSPNTAYAIAIMESKSQSKRRRRR